MLSVGYSVGIYFNSSKSSSSHPEAMSTSNIYPAAQQGPGKAKCGIYFCPNTQKHAHKYLVPFPLPEFLVGLGEILVNDAQVRIISQKHLIGSCMLEHLGNGAKISALVRGELASG